ncbi:MAG: hypothetical protein ICV64_08805 [Thermoleophilia bacterium]|nr:hypothetical protein [Thermoleophilia bacterium]
MAEDVSNLQPDIDAEDPGLDVHDWEARYQQLLPDLEGDPYSGLPELADLTEEMLADSGYAVDDPVVREGQSPDVVREYLAAREVSDRVERGEDVGPGDIAQAILGLRAVYDELATNRPG